MEFVDSAQHQPDGLLLCHCEEGNRGNQSDSGCRSCGYQAHADINAAENIRQGRCKPAERDVVQNRLSHSFRFRRLSAAVTGPRL